MHLDIDHPDIIEFVRTPRHELPWVKRCVNLTKDGWEATTDEAKSAILEGIRSGDIWLNKIKYDKEGNRIEVMYASKYIYLAVVLVSLVT